MYLNAIVSTICFFFQGLKKAYLTSYITYTFLQVSISYSQEILSTATYPTFAEYFSLKHQNLWSLKKLCNGGICCRSYDVMSDSSFHFYTQHFYKFLSHIKIILPAAPHPKTNQQIMTPPLFQRLYFKFKLGQII